MVLLGLGLEFRDLEVCLEPKQLNARLPSSSMPLPPEKDTSQRLTKHFAPPTEKNKLSTPQGSIRLHAKQKIKHTLSDLPTPHPSTNSGDSIRHPPRPTCHSSVWQMAWITGRSSMGSNVPLRSTSKASNCWKQTSPGRRWGGGLHRRHRRQQKAGDGQHKEETKQRASKSTMLT